MKASREALARIPSMRVSIFSELAALRAAMTEYALIQGDRQ